MSLTAKEVPALSACTRHVSAHSDTPYHASPYVHCRLFGHQPQVTGSVTALVSVNFLNNSTSSWEVMMEPWPVELLLSNPTNKIFKDARTT